MKKVLFIINLITVFVILPVVCFATLTGDLNGNGKTDIGDARLILRYSAKLTDFDENEIITGDIDGNGKVNVSDARKILRIIAKLDGPPEVKTAKTETVKTQLQSVDIYKKASQYTVEIHCFDKNGNSSGNASAFFIDGEGTLATNFHVIENAYSAYIIDYGGNKYPVNGVYAYSKSKDIAVISTDKKTDDYAVISDGYLTGEYVYTLGSPLGLTGTFTSGMISTAEREFKELNNGVRYIQFTAPITNGNSGGPLINKYGEVIGISSLSYISAQNLNFAVPAYEINLLTKTNIMSVPAFYNLIHSDFSGENTFYGLILPYSNNITLAENETVCTYVIGIANSDYNIYAQSLTEGFSVKTGDKNGNATSVYITADGTAETGKIKVFFDKNSNISAVLTVTCQMK